MATAEPGPGPSPSPSKPTCAVTFGRSTLLGRHLAAALAASGRWSTVAVLDPSPPTAAISPSSPLAHHIAVDLSDPAAPLARVLDGAEAVFHVDPTSGGEGSSSSSFLSLHREAVEGTRRLLAVCAEGGVRRVVYTGSADVVVSAAAARDVVGAGEDALPYPDKFGNAAMEVRAQVEMMVLSADGKNGMRTCVLRPSNMFGPGDSSLARFVAGYARSPLGKFVIGDGANLCDFTYVENVAHANICAEQALCSNASSVAGKDGITRTVGSLSELPDNLDWSRKQRSCGPSKAEKLLGSGITADILLWRDEKKTFSYITVLFLLFYWFLLSERTFVSSAAKILLVISLALFIHGVLPPQVFGFTVEKVTSDYFEVPHLTLRNPFMWLASLWNGGIHKLRVLAEGDDWTTFLKAVAFLYCVKLLLNFQFRMLMGLVLAFLFVVFIVYEQCEEEIDSFVAFASVKLKSLMGKAGSISPRAPPMSSEPPPPAPQDAAVAAGGREASSSLSPAKESAPAGGGGGGGSGPPETNTLWVGNLPAHASEDDVMAAFSPHGGLDCAMARAGPRSYAFVLFRSVAEARAALGSLQGSKVKGSPLKIEFARPARAVKSLWVGGISSSISKEELEEEFKKFGQVDGVAFSCDQTAAYIDFDKLENAISAHRALNGAVLGGQELCVDFQRSRGRAEWLETGSFNSRVGPPKGSSGVRNREAQPTNVLWVGFPNASKMNEEALRQAMAVYGVVTNTKVFPTRQYAFVEFATIGEASNAKKNLDGRLFNDQRIQILFSNSELAPNKLDNPTAVSGFPRSEMYHDDGQYGASDYFDPRRGRSRYFDYSGVPVSGGILPSPESSRPFLTGRSAQNTFDPRESKRLRLDTAADAYDARAGSEGLYPSGYSQREGAVRSERSSSPVIRIKGTVHRTSYLEHFWRGGISKGGSPVCRARCLPIGKGIEIPLPDIVDCTARTGLETLARHYEDATAFDIVFFLPDSEDDFLPYTEFLRYLGSKSRAGVVKVDAGATLFLVPPSDFLKNVLQVDGPERLYGLVLHIPQISAAPAVHRPQLTAPESQPYYDEREIPSQRSYSMVTPNNHQYRDADYRGSSREDALHQSGQIPARARVDEGHVVQPTLASFPMNQTAGLQVPSSLNPDIMATLAKFLPSAQSSAPLTGHVPLSSTDRPVLSQMNNASTLSKLWRPENQAIAPTSSFEQMGNFPPSGQQFSKQAGVAHQPNYGNLAGAQEHLAQHSAYNPEMSLNLPPPPPPPPTLPPSAAMLSSQVGNSLPMQMSQQPYQPEQYYMSQSNYGPLAAASHSNLQAHQQQIVAPPAAQAPAPQAPVAAQAPPAAQAPVAAPAPNMQAPAAAQAPADEAERNRKYQATLELAHRLLGQIRKPGNQPSG
uniref:Reticulon-like protein n=1 Tax=Leersia perrieri TaxID=77586 RepID=A0A0D9XFN4_9ORYZ